LESISLYELTEYIQRVVALNFTEPIWVHFELSQVSSSRGHWYLDCVETGVTDNQVIAQMRAVIWQSDYLRIFEKHGPILRDLLKDGVKISALAHVNFHTRYGLQLKLIDIDPSYTIGEIELQRQAIIQQLMDEGLFDFNRELFIPEIIKRIAIISSPTAAGYEDFKIHLRDNPYGYTFHTQLFEASMQGQNTEAEVCAQLEAIPADRFDVIVILRGGGSRMDLSAFDSYDIAVKIAYSSLPVLTGIGHEKDISVTDLVANTNLKTPTALANFIIDHNAEFESKIIELANAISRFATMTIQREHAHLAQVTYQLKYSLQQTILGQLSALDILRHKISHTTKQYLNEAHTAIVQIENKLTALDPRQVLERGYTLSYIDGKKLTSIKYARAGSAMQTVLKDGIITSKITKNNG